VDIFLSDLSWLGKEIFFKIDSLGGYGGFKLGAFNKKSFNKNFVMGKICKALLKANIALQNNKNPSKDCTINTFFMQEMASHSELGDTRIYFRSGKIMSVFTRQAASLKQNASNLAQGSYLSYIAPTLEELEENPNLMWELEKYLPLERFKQAMALAEVQQKIINITKDSSSATVNKIGNNGFLGFDALIMQDENGKFNALCGEINNNHSTMGPGQVVTKKSLDYLFASKEFCHEVEKLIKTNNIELNTNFKDSNATEVKLFFLQQTILNNTTKGKQEYLCEQFHSLLQNRFFEIIEKAQKDASKFTYIFYQREYECSIINEQ
jgi:hypothetical protein